MYVFIICGLIIIIVLLAFWLKKENERYLTSINVLSTEIKFNREKIDDLDKNLQKYKKLYLDETERNLRFSSKLKNFENNESENNTK